MKVGDAVKFEFAGKKKQGTIFKLFPNSIHMKVDFERQQGKIVKRKLSQVEGGKPTPKDKKKADK